MPELGRGTVQSITLLMVGSKGPKWGAGASSPWLQPKVPERERPDVYTEPEGRPAHVTRDSKLYLYWDPENGALAA